MHTHYTGLPTEWGACPTGTQCDAGECPGDPVSQRPPSADPAALAAADGDALCFLCLLLLLSARTLLRLPPEVRQPHCRVKIEFPSSPLIDPLGYEQLYRQKEEEQVITTCTWALWVPGYHWAREKFHLHDALSFFL